MALSAGSKTSNLESYHGSKKDAPALNHAPSTLANFIPRRRCRQLLNARMQRFY